MGTNLEKSLCLPYFEVVVTALQNEIVEHTTGLEMGSGACNNLFKLLTWDGCSRSFGTNLPKHNLQHFTLRILTLASVVFLCLYWMGDTGFKTSMSWAVSAGVCRHDILDGFVVWGVSYSFSDRYLYFWIEGVCCITGHDKVQYDTFRNRRYLMIKPLLSGQRYVCRDVSEWQDSQTPKGCWVE
jgi:hypothetical protein